MGRYLSILTRFLKDSADDYAGLLPRKMRIYSERHGIEIRRSCVLPSDKREACRALFRKYCRSLQKRVVEDYRQLRQREKTDKRILMQKGELHEERSEQTEKQRADFEKLLQNCNVFSDLVDEDPVQLPEIKDDLVDEPGSLELFRTTEVTDESDLWGDGDTRQFYENLPDIRAMVPAILYADGVALKRAKAEAAAAAAAATAAEQEAGSDAAKDEPATAETSELSVEQVEKEMALLDAAADADASTTTTTTGGSGGGAIEDDQADGQQQQETSEEREADGTDKSATCVSQQEQRVLFDAFLNKLPSCVSRDLTDAAALEFVQNFNSKPNRQRLVKTLFGVHRTRYDLLPFYGRFVASLAPCLPDVPVELAAMLRRDFNYHMKKKDQLMIESKLKVVRFMGELVKFGQYDAKDCLNCLMWMLHDFTHHNIDMSCALLEACGRFLFFTPATHQKTKVLLQIMMRKKESSLNLDQNQMAMIDNSFYSVQPPTDESLQLRSQEKRPPMHEFIRKLVFRDLNKNSVEKVCRQLRKLHWEDGDLRAYLVKCLSSSWNVRHNCISCLAALLDQLGEHHEEVVTEVVDNVLEDVRLGMELNEPKFNQRRLATVHFLATLFEYYVVEAPVIFATLYSLITFGVSPLFSQLREQMCPKTEPDKDANDAGLAGVVGDADKKTEPEDDSAAPSSSLDQQFYQLFCQPDAYSVIDPPEHLLRIRLCCEIITVCGKFFSKGNSARKLDCIFSRLRWHNEEGEGKRGGRGVVFVALFLPGPGRNCLAHR